MGNKRCYWCGKPATSVEHVPPENLFPKDRKSNLITVPSCSSHNEELSHLDELFRFYLQSCSASHDAAEMFKEKAIRSITRPEGKKLARLIFQGSQRILVNGEEKLLLNLSKKGAFEYFEKITRGIYFKLFKKPLIGKVSVASPQFFNPKLDYKNLQSNVGPFLESSRAINGTVSQPEIFRYRYFHSLKPPVEAFVLMTVFYNSVLVLSLVLEGAGEDSVLL